MQNQDDFRKMIEGITYPARDIDADARAEGFKNWEDKYMHEKFMTWLRDKGWAYNRDMEIAFIAGYNKRAEDE